jgi:hypothetical protein
MMRWTAALLPAAALLLSTAAGPAVAADPSGGWLSYAVFRAKPTDVITRLSATMVVPPTPKTPKVAAGRSAIQTPLSIFCNGESLLKYTQRRLNGSTGRGYPKGFPAFWFGLQTAEGDGALVQLGLGRIVALHHRSSTAHQFAPRGSFPQFLRRRSDRTPGPAHHGQVARRL